MFILERLGGSVDGRIEVATPVTDSSSSLVCSRQGAILLRNSVAAM